MARRRGRRSPRKDLPLRHAVVLGLVHGPAELLPVSSSGHVVLLPALLGWPYGRLSPAERKAFEVMLHGGTAIGLAAVLRDELREAARDTDLRGLAGDVLAIAPAAACGLMFHDAISERLSAPRHVALAQILAGVALAVADLRPADRAPGHASPADALAVGVGQAAALAPGVSRSGAVLTALRLRRLERRSAGRISRRAAAPVVIGAGLLEAVRLARRPPSAALAPPFGAGATAALASTLAAGRLVQVMDRARSYVPVAAYRVALGTLALHRLGPARRRLPALRRALEWRS